MDERRPASGGVPIYGLIKQRWVEPGMGGQRTCVSTDRGALGHLQTLQVLRELRPHNTLCRGCQSPLSAHPGPPPVWAGEAPPESGPIHVPHSSLFSGGADLISEPPSPPCGTTCFAEDREGSGGPWSVSGGDGHAERLCDLEGAFPLTPSVLPFHPHDIGRALTAYLWSPGSSSFFPEGEVFPGCRKPASKGGQGGGALIMRPTFLRGFV